MELRSQTHASPLGEWRVSIATPPPHLRSCIAMLWDVEGVVNYARESVLPSGHVEILINLGAVQHLVDRDDGTSSTRYTDAWVSGLQQRNILIESRGSTHLVGIRLTPLAASRILRVPMTEIVDLVVDADQILGSEVRELRATLQSIDEPAIRMASLAGLVVRRLEKMRESAPGLERSVAILAARRGRLRVSRMAELAECSERHLVRLFRDRVGVNPKRYAEILQLQNSAERIKRDPQANLADLALCCGYYDQSHFNHAFRRFAGVTPTEFASSVLPDEVTEAMVLD